MEDRFLEDGPYEEPAGSEPAADFEPPWPLRAGAHGRRTSKPDRASSSSGPDGPAPVTPTVGDAASDSPPDGAAAGETDDARAPAFDEAPTRVPPLASRARGRRLVRKSDAAPHAFTPEQRLLLPEPLCPDGSLAAAPPDGSVSEPPVPGVSPLDQVLPEIAAALDPRRCEEGGADL